MGLLIGTQEQVRNSHSIQAIRVLATDVLLNHPMFHISLGRLSTTQGTLVKWVGHGAQSSGRS